MAIQPLCRFRAAAIAAAATLSLSALHARAQVIDIAWSDGGEFKRSVSVAPGKFAELCGALKPGQAVQWQFEADRALDFNIHFHEGEAVRYPARTDQAPSLQGTLAVDAACDCCWMWPNKSAAPAALQVRLQRR